MNLAEKGIKIRETVESDLRQIYTLGLTCSSLHETRLPFNAENIAELLTAEKVIALTAVRGKIIIGFIFGSFKNNTCLIEWITVMEKFREKGIGSEMLSVFYEKAKNFSIDNFFIALFTNNSESVKFFNKRGFTVVKNYIKLCRNSDEKNYQGLYK